MLQQKITTHVDVLLQHNFLFPEDQVLAQVVGYAAVRATHPGLIPEVEFRRVSPIKIPRLNGTCIRGCIQWSKRLPALREV